MVVDVGAHAPLEVMFLMVQEDYINHHFMGNVKILICAITFFPPRMAQLPLYLWHFAYSSAQFSRVVFFLMSVNWSGAYRLASIL